MKYLLFFSIVTLVFLTSSSLVFAHTYSESPMMQPQARQQIMQLEDQLLEDEGLHIQMEEYMNAMLTGELTEEQQQQMLEWMRSDMYQPVMMSMLMRGMMGNTWVSQQDRGMMGSWMLNSWMGFGGWVTMILVWVFLALGIGAFWKTLRKSHS